MGKEIQTPQNATPSYFNLEPHKREEVLAQIGSFTQIQYQIFHNICDFWDPALDYNQYVLKTNKPALTGGNQLELLMNKIQDAHMGLLQYRLVDSELKPARLVLTEKDSIYFYYYICEEVLYRNVYESGHPFITVKTFDKYGITFPGEMITPLDPKSLSPGFHKKMMPQCTIFGITRRNRSPILIPSGLLDEYILFLMKNLIRESQSMTLLENVSRLSGIKISELQKRMTARDPSFWITLTKSLLEHKEDLNIRIKGLSPLIFTSSHLLYSYFFNSLTELKEKQQEKAERQKTQMEIVNRIRENGTRWSSVKQLDQELKEKEKTWEGFRKEFQDTILKRQDNGEQPDLIIVNSQVIHKDYLFPFFKKELEYAGKEFSILYQDMMNDLLRNNQPDKYTQFYSRNNFRADILNRIRNKSPQLKELLQKPSLIATAGYYYLKDLKGIKRSDTIKDSINTYLKSDLKQFQNIDDILHLSLISLFDNAFDNLGWWSKLILRLSGRYDSYTSSFSTTSSIARAANSKKRQAAALRGNTGYAEKQQMTSQSRLRSRSRQQAQQQKMHSVREKKKAWAEFSDAVNKKK